MKTKRVYWAKFYFVLLVATLMVSLFSAINTKAKKKTLSGPEFSLKVGKDKASVKISISKTKNADGYEIYYSGYGDIYEGYRDNYDEELIPGTDKKGFGIITTINKNGSKKRTATVKPPVSGKLAFVVRSFKKNADGTLSYSKFSSSKSVTLYTCERGYKEKYDFSNLKVGDYFEFGSYEQDNDFSNGREPIEWQVLSKTDTEMFIVSRYVLDCMPFNNDMEMVTWNTCDLRRWLNEKFYDIAFNETEKNTIKTVKVETNSTFKTRKDARTHECLGSEMWGGIPAYDNVFLLSVDDCVNEEYGFYIVSQDREYYGTCGTEPTAYAKAQGVYASDGIKNMCPWWTRSPGEAGFTINGDIVFNLGKDGIKISESEAAYIGISGIRGSQSVTNPYIIMSMDTYKHNGYGVGVRPALKINLQKDNKFNKLKMGDTVCIGSYEQDNIVANGTEEIEWIVLSKDDNELCLLSKYALDCKPYNDGTGCGWENSSLRTWLNEDFYKTVFDDSERRIIKSMKINNSKRDMGYSKENDTVDKVFLLASGEAEEFDYFLEYGDRFWSNIIYDNLMCSPTKYAVAKGVEISKDCKNIDGGDTCLWWTRTMWVSDDDWDTYTKYVHCIPEDGSGIETRGQESTYIGVRPVIVIDLKK